MPRRAFRFTALKQGLKKTIIKIFHCNVDLKLIDFGVSGSPLPTKYHLGYIYPVGNAVLGVARFAVALLHIDKRQCVIYYLY